MTPIIFFGYKNTTHIGVNSKTVEFKRPEILDFSVVRKIAISSDETAFYFYGNKSTYDTYNIYKYNYITLEIEAVADVIPRSSEQSSIKIINNELCYKQGPEIYIYDPTNLKYQYKLSLRGFEGFSDFVWLKKDIWLVVTINEIYTYKRGENKLVLVDSTEHYTMNHGAYNPTKVVKLNDNDVLVGHQSEDFSYKLNIDNDGLISAKKSVNIPIRTQSNTYVNENLDVLLNSFDNSSYKLSDNSKNTSLSNPMIIRGVSLDSFDVYGTNNDPEDHEFKNYERKAKILSLNGTLRTIETKGFSMFMFKNHLGSIISISSGLEKSVLSSSSPRKNVFVEIIE